jgi:hypothetical protein
MAEAMTPSEVGALTELAVANALTRAGFTVFVPFFNAHSRIDLVYVDGPNRPQRIQCKTGTLVENTVSFWTCSNTGGVRETYVDDVDAFGVYCSATRLVYVVPVGDAPSRQARLRLEPPRNNQRRHIRWADQYVIGPPW